ncbi:MAG TPA: hypothetical protein DCR14_13280 [Acidimicrobiaceae bacterium]|nr:hypothetical protein [Acidimicrobiaceae bacterium]
MELIVADLDRAVELCCDVLGLTLLSRGPATLVPGEVATVDLGGLVLTLLCPAADGEGDFLADRSPRLSQLVLAVDGLEAVAELVRVAGRHGLVAQQTADDRCYLTPESVEGALGVPTAVVAVVIPADAQP